MIDPTRGHQQVDGRLGVTKAEPTAEDLARAARATRRWCTQAGVDDVDTRSLLDMLGLE